MDIHKSRRAQIFPGRFFFPCLMLIDQIVIRSVTRIPRWPDPISCTASITGIIFNCSLHTSNRLESREEAGLTFNNFAHHSLFNGFEHVTLPSRWKDSKFSRTRNDGSHFMPRLSNSLISYLVSCLFISALMRVNLLLSISREYHHERYNTEVV